MPAFPSLDDLAPEPLYLEPGFRELARVDLPVASELEPWNVEAAIQPIFSAPSPTTPIADGGTLLSFDHRSAERGGSGVMTVARRCALFPIVICLAVLRVPGRRARGDAERG